MDFSKQQEMYAKVVQKAWEDPNFKSSLVADPLATLEAFTGQSFKLPPGQTLVVRDQTDPSTIYINIPQDKTSEDVVLTDEQLEAVAGGGIIYDAFHDLGSWVRSWGDPNAFWS